MLTIFRKELADHFSSVRFLILFCVILMVALFTTYMAGSSLREDLAGVAKPGFVFLMLFTSGPFSLVEFIAFFGPLIGLVMGFDAINRERNQGTLSKLVSQPIYRDAVINGKFLAGLVTISIMLTSLVLLISGLGLLTLGVVPGGEEVARLLIYLVVSIVYVSFWLGLAILFSILFRSVATSALAAVAVWVLFIFMVGLGAGMLADAVVPLDVNSTRNDLIKHEQAARTAMLISPRVLYNDATSTILDPTRRSTRSLMRDIAARGKYEQVSMTYFSNPLGLGQSTLLVVPYLTTLLALGFVCFGVSYLAFMRQEIRSV